MDLPVSTIKPSPNMGDIRQNLVGRLQAIVALEHDCRWVLPPERVIQQIERRVRYRVRM